MIFIEGMLTVKGIRIENRKYDLLRFQNKPRKIQESKTHRPTSTMAARFSSSAVFRSVIATHVSLTSLNLMHSACGKSQLPTARQKNSTTTFKNGIHLSKPASDNNIDTPHPPPMTNDLATTCSALPWLDQLHNIIACMYIGGGAHCRGHKDNVMVQIKEEASFENPIVSYAGVEEIERAFRGRLFLRAKDANTLLECVHVEASDDSGAGLFSSEEVCLHRQDENSTSTSIIGSPLSNNYSSPPTVEVTYILSQSYGSYLSINSMLAVTVQVREGCPQKVHETMADKLKVGIPIATSSHQGISAGNSSNQTLVAEVVRIEERWNGVELLKFAPFHWSRRLNGLVAGGLAFLLFK